MFAQTDSGFFIYGNKIYFNNDPGHYSFTFINCFVYVGVPQVQCL